MSHSSQLPATVPQPFGAALAPAVSAAAATYLAAGLQGADNTRRAYLSDLRSFDQFCAERQQCPLPASVATLIEYVTHLADTPARPRANARPGALPRPPRKFATLKRHLAAIQKNHLLRGYPSAVAAPELAAVLDGIARLKGKRQKQAPAFTVEHLKDVIRGLDRTTPGGLRDRALLLLGFAGAFRRSELAALDASHVRLTSKALLIDMVSSKTNQHGELENKAVFYAPDELFCPVRAVLEWQALLGRTTGPLFVRLARGAAGEPARLGQHRLTAKGINELVQKHFGQHFTAHSLRAAFVTVAVQKGQSNKAIKNQTKQKTDAMIERYARLNDVETFNAAQHLGL
jgi:integrase